MPFAFVIAIAIACVFGRPEILHAQSGSPHTYAALDVPMFVGGLHATAPDVDVASGTDLFELSASPSTGGHGDHGDDGDHEGDDDGHDDDHEDDHSISCLKYTDLDFGGACAGLTSGTIVMSADPQTERSSTGGVTLDSRNPGHPAMLKLTIYNDSHCQGDDHRSNDDDECDREEDDDHHEHDDRETFQRHGTTTSIHLPSSSTLSLYSGGRRYTMEATDFTVSRTDGTIHIGATLHVGANQAAGVYHGSFSVTETCE